MAGTRIQLKDLNLKPYISTGSAVAYNISVERVEAYDDKETFFIDFHTTCGDAPTLNINGLGAKNITIGGVNLSTGQLLSDSGYFIKYSSTLDKFVLIGGGSGGTMNCSDVKDCIENFTDLDLSNLETLILGGPSTDIYINGSTLYYDGVTENRSGDNTINLEEGASITNNLDGTVNNNYGDTYEENNVYEDGSTFNHTGEVTNNYEDYTENNDYGDNVEINNNYSSDTVINHNGGTHNYSSDTQVNFEGDTSIENLEVTNITLSGGGAVQLTGAWEYEETPLEALTYTLTNTPISDKGFMVFVDSGIGLFPTTDYTYDSGTQTITFSPQLGATEKAIIWVMVGSTPDVVDNNIKRVKDVVWTGPGTQLVVTDADCTTDSVIMGRTIKSGTQIGFRQFTVGTGQFTIDSTDSESGITFNYVIYK